MMKRLILFISILLALSANAHAQTDIPVGKPFTLAWDCLGECASKATGYDVEINGVIVGGISNVATTTFLVDARATCGQLIFRVFAKNQFGSAPSAPLTANIVGASCAPPGPNNLRFIISMARGPDGKYTLEITGVELEK
jgi:hypothetical protein